MNLISKSGLSYLFHRGLTLINANMVDRACKNFQSSNQSINQPANQSIDQQIKLINQSTKQSPNQPTNQPINQSTNQSIQSQFYLSTYVRTATEASSLDDPAPTVQKRLLDSVTDVGWTHDGQRQLNQKAAGQQVAQHVSRVFFLEDKTWNY